MTSNKQKGYSILILLLIIIVIIAVGIAGFYVRHSMGKTTNSNRPADNSSTTEFVKGEIMVSFKDEVPIDRINKIFSEQKLKILEAPRPSDTIKIYVVGVKSGQEEHYISKLSSYPEVKYSELNYIRHIQ